MTPALLFALVDAVLNQRREASWRMRAWDSHKEQWAVARDQLGWWRSRWEVGRERNGLIAEMKRIKAEMDAMPAPIVLMQAPVARGALYVEAHPGALVQMKERVRVALIHRDDIPLVQAAHVDAGFPPLRVVTGDDMRPWNPDALTLEAK